jgi:tetratricopeptide (TPR) repeat protein
MSDTVISLNNAAIAYFQEGLHDVAVENLTRAIDLLLRAMNDEPLAAMFFSMSTDLQMHSNSNLESWSDLKKTIPQLQLQRVKLGPAPCASQEVCISFASIYARAVLITKNYPISYCDKFYNEIGAIILFNLAVISHWRGIHLCKFTELLKALRFYEMATVIIEQYPGDLDMHHLALAVYQNMGHIHLTLYHRTEAEACFESLRHLLSHVSDIRSVLPEDDFAAFFISAMFQGNELHLAPAA